MTSSTRCNPPLQQHSSKSGLELASLDMYCGTLLAKLGIRRHRCANRAPPTSRCTGTARGAESSLLWDKLYISQQILYAPHQHRPRGCSNGARALLSRHDHAAPNTTAGLSILPRAEPTNGISDVFGRYGDVLIWPLSAVPRRLRGSIAQLAAVYKCKHAKRTATLGGVNYTL